jgi:hypothetical protein
VLYVHGSTGSRPLLGASRQGEAGFPRLRRRHADRRSGAGPLQFHHSANYRSVVAHGRATTVTDAAEKAAVLTALVEKIAAGRSAATRRPRLRNWRRPQCWPFRSSRWRPRCANGPVADDEEDYALPYWAGIVPLRQEFGEPRPDAGVGELPEYLRAAVTGVTV